MRQTTIELDATDRLASVARERVNWCGLLRTTVDIDGAGTARILVRRRPGTHQPVWLQALDEHIDPSLPEVQHAIGVTLTRLRDELGYPHPESTLGAEMCAPLQNGDRQRA